MKHTFKKVVVLALAVIMCLSTIVPSATAATATCPGKGSTHTAYNCTYTEGATSAATCDAAGSVLGVCNGCGDKFILNTVAATGHDWEYSDADCDTASYRTCKTCKKVELVKAAAGHAWGDWVVTGGVCRVGEQRTQTCTVCGVKNYDIMTEEHSWILDEFVAPERCGLPGYSVYVCANGCGAEKSEDVWLYGVGAGHSKWISWADAYDKKLVDTKNDPNYAKQSCTVEGMHTEVCEDCGVTKVVNEGKNGTHTNADIGIRLQFIDYVAEDCCTGNGKEAYWKCYDCGKLYKAVCIDGTTTLANGTIYPNSYENVTKEASDGAMEVVSQKFRYYTDRIGDAVKDNKLANVVTIDSLTHKWRGVSVAATCTTAGYTNRFCAICGTTQNTTTAALGHMFAPDVPSADQRSTIELVYNTVNGTDDYNAKDNNWTAFVRLNSSIKKNVVEATCTTDGGYTWRCLRKGCYNTATEGAKEVVVPATGHNFSTTEKNNTANDAPTCTRPGVDRFVCNNGCGITNNVAVPALGHDMKSTTVAATCATEGSVTEYCSRKATCGLEDKVTVLPKDPNNHEWTDVASMPKKPANCTEDGYGTHYCSNCSIDPVAYTVPATGHKYLEGNELAKAIKSLTTVNGTVSKNGKVVVKYLQAGDCTKVAKYKLTCVNAGCEMFTSYEISEGFNVGKHDVVIVYDNPANNNMSPNAGTPANNEIVKDIYDVYGKITSGFSGLHQSYGPKAPAGHTTNKVLVAAGINYLWYCKNAGCPYARTNSNPTNAAPIDAMANGHYIIGADGSLNNVTFADVPDERISKLTSYDKAKDVKAPVDENGNVTAIAIDIPGTTLVWRYKLDANCEYDEVVAGGFWCVECQASYGETGAGCTVGAKKGHSLPATGSTVRPDCQNYGYVRYECTFAGCDYAVVTNYTAATEHTFALVDNDPKNDVAPTCLLDGYKFLECTLCGINKVDVPESYKATGHFNATGEALFNSCLSVVGGVNNTATNRLCKSCSTVIVSDHMYDTNNVCVYCGRTKQN